MIKRCNDFGAGGVSVAIGELADGLKIDLDKVPKKYEGLDGTELAISESQERMAVVVDKSDVEKFENLARKENLESTVVAEVTDENRLEMTWRGDKIVDLSRDFLNTNGVVQHAAVEIEAIGDDEYRTQVPSALEKMTNAEALKANLSRLEVCSQKGLVERFDSSIGASTVLMPYAGKYHSGGGNGCKNSAYQGRNRHGNRYGIRIYSESITLVTVPQRGICSNRIACKACRSRMRPVKSKIDIPRVF